MRVLRNDLPHVRWHGTIGVVLQEVKTLVPQLLGPTRHSGLVRVRSPLSGTADHHPEIGEFTRRDLREHRVECFHGALFLRVVQIGG